MLKTLSLRNFKKHAELDVAFGPGLNGIVGPNYRGKTTILYGILYALGGTTAVPAKNLQTLGTNTGFKVELAFDLTGTGYHVLRTKSKAELYRGEAMIANGTTEVNRQIAQLLGMNIKRFRELKWARQGRTEAILTLGATQLFNIVSDLTGVNDVNEAIVKLEAIRKGTAQALDLLPVGDIEQRQAEVTEAEGIATTAKATWEKSTEQLELARIELDQRTGVHAELVARTIAYDRASQAIVNWVDKLEAAQTRAGDANGAFEAAALAVKEYDYVNQLPIWSARADELNHVQGEIRALRKQLPALTEAAEQAKGTYLRRQAAVGALRVQGQAHPGELPDRQQILLDSVELRNKITQSQADIAKLQATLEKAICPECNRPLDGIDADWQQKQTERLQAAVDAVPSLEAKVPEVAAQLAEVDRWLDFDQQLAVADRLETDAYEAFVQAGLARSTVAGELETKINAEALTAELETVNAQFKAGSEALTRCDAAQKRAKAAQLEYDELKATPNPPQAPAAGPAAAEIEAATVAVQTWREAVQTLSTESATLGRSEAVARAQLAAAELALEQAKKSEAERNTLAVRFDTANTLDKYLRESRDRFTGSVWNQFMAQASMFASNCTDGAIEEIGRDEETGQFMFKEAGEWLPVEDASGCQQAVMGMAVQEALSDAARCPLDVLLADEISASMDATHSAAMLTLLGSTGKQVITVSHEEIDNSIFNHVIQL